MTARPLHLAATAAMAAALAACAAVGPDYKPPEAPAVSGYAMRGDDASAATTERLSADWWSLFHSPEIDQTVRQAVANNHSLQGARAALAEAYDAIAAQQSRLSLDANIGAQRERVNLTSFGFSQFPIPGGGVLVLSNPTFSDYSFGLTGHYDFDLFGGRRREHEQLQARAEAQGEQTDAAMLTLSAQVVSQAIDIASLKAQIAAEEEIVSADQADLDRADKSFKLGGGTRLDVATVQTELAGDNGAIPELRQRLAAARHALALLAGQAPSAWEPPEFDLDKLGQPAALPVELPSELVHSRPDIRAAEARLHAATAQIGVAQADLYPKLTLNAGITQSALHPQDVFKFGATGYAIGPSLSVPLFHGEELRAKRRMAEDAARQALANYQQTVLQAFVQVADSLQAIAHDDELITTSQQALQASTDSLRLQRLRFDDGKVALLPVLDAQRSYARARLGLVRARAQRLQDTAALLYAVSQRWDAPEAGAAQSAANPQPVTR